MATTTLTVIETSKLLGIGRDQTYNAIHRGEIPSLRLGGRILVPRAKLVELLGEFDEPTASDH